ncbi:MAG: hypothetical protein ACRC9H_11375 [Aeromonas veronii]
MAHIVAGKLRKPTFIKDGCGPDGQSKMYGIELAEVIKDYKTGEKSYTNYKALFFAKTDAAKNYYDQALAEGSYVVVACEKIKLESREHNGQVYHSLVMENPRLEGANYTETAQNSGWGQPQHAMPQSQPQRQAPQQQQQQRQPSPQQNMQQSQQQYANPPMNFDDDIPFATVGLQYRALLNAM